MNHIQNVQHQVVKDYYDYIQHTTAVICYRRRIKERMDVEDIQQNIFLKILESRNEAYNTSYINKVIHSCITDYFRKANNIYYDDKDIDLIPSPHHDNIDAIVLDNILKKHLRSKALKIVQMRLLRYSYAEIAKVVNLSAGNCRLIYHRSAAKLMDVANVELLDD